MKVIDIEIYRTRRSIRALEQKIGQLALGTAVGSVREMKTCFKEWIKVNSHR